MNEKDRLSRILFRDIGNIITEELIREIVEEMYAKYINKNRQSGQTESGVRELSGDSGSHASGRINEVGIRDRAGGKDPLSR
jgi:hypothetical protein